MPRHYDKAVLPRPTRQDSQGSTYIAAPLVRLIHDSPSVESMSIDNLHLKPSRILYVTSRSALISLLFAGRLTILNA